MEGGVEGMGISPAMAQWKLSEGEELVVQMDHKTLLKKVMQALGATNPPIYTVYECPNDAARVSIKLDVACTKYSVGSKINVAVIDSELCPTRIMAEKQAVAKAFKHLNEQHLVKIKDFSSRVANKVDGQTCYGDVNSALYSLEKVLDQWEGVFAILEDMGSTVAGKEGAAAIDADAKNEAKMYKDFNDFLEMTLATYKVRVTDARSKLTEVERGRNKHRNKSTEKYHADLRKGYLQTVILPCKDVLSYLLTNIGAGQPTYSNGPTKNGMIRGTVMFNLPDIPDVDISGNMTIPAKSTNSRDAEERAAFEAIQYLERRYKLKVVDLNHAERVDAENDEKKLIHLLEEAVLVTDDVKKYWGKMVKTVAAEKSAYPIGGEKYQPGPPSAKKNEVYKYLSNCIEDLDKENAKRYGECAHRFEEIHKIGYKIEGLKIELMMD